MIVPEEMIFKLTKSLEYQDSDGNQTTEELFLLAPKGRHERMRCKFQQVLVRGILEVAKSVRGTDNSTEKGGRSEVTPEEKEELLQSDEGKEAMGKQTLMALQFADGDLFEHKALFADMVCQTGIAFVDPGHRTQLTKTLLNSIPYYDTDRLLGMYLGNFLLPS